MVRTQDLPQEDPQRDQWRVDSVHPKPLDRLQCSLDEVFREDVGERQVAVLKELTPQKTDLLAKPTLVRMTHPCGLLAADGFVRENHLRK
jgi:hypothetical protein